MTASEETTALEYEEWASTLADGTLLGQECGACGHVTAAPKVGCARCGNDALETIELPTEGEVHSETKIFVTPEDFEGPYSIAIVSLDSAKVMAQVPADVDIDDTVAFEGIVDANGRPAPRFEPV